MEEILEEFISQEGTPTDEQLETLAAHWKEYIGITNTMRALSCDKDFMMGMVIMAKRLTK